MSRIIKNKPCKRCVTLGLTFVILGTVAGFATFGIIFYYQGGNVGRGQIVTYDLTYRDNSIEEVVDILDAGWKQGAKHMPDVTFSVGSDTILLKPPNSAYKINVSKSLDGGLVEYDISFNFYYKLIYGGQIDQSCKVIFQSGSDTIFYFEHIRSTYTYLRHGNGNNIVETDRILSGESKDIQISVKGDTLTYGGSEYDIEGMEMNTIRIWFEFQANEIRISDLIVTGR